MQRIIPGDYVLTSVAITELQQCDAEWQRLKDLHDQADTRQRGEFARIDLGKRTDELRAVLLGEARAGVLTALVVSVSEGGHWQSVPLPLDYLADELTADLALNRGAVIASDALHDRDNRRFDGEALCFRRADWNAWLAVATAKSERWTVPQAAAEPPNVAQAYSASVASAGRLPMWTIPMSCVWAATRDIEAVAHVEESEPDSEEWLFVDDSLPFWPGAHVLTWRSRLLVRAGDLPLPDLGVALLQLQEHAARGTIVVRGLLRDEGKAEAIPADAWANLQIMTWRSLPGFIAGPHDLQPSAYWWSRLRVLPDELLKVWPRVPSERAEEATAQQPAASATKSALPGQDCFDVELKRRLQNGFRGRNGYRDDMIQWARGKGKSPDEAKTLWKNRYNKAHTAGRHKQA